MGKGAVTKCRVCGSGNVTKLGSVEYYIGFESPIYDCGHCLCRFTTHDESTYEMLHDEPGSCYYVYREFLERCKKAYLEKDIDALKSHLSQGTKYKFVIDECNSKPQDTKVLEIGCARGHLTSYFILAGYHTTGVDVSESAIREARGTFGNHFVVNGDPSVDENAPYDVIYHVGTIGCVADPVGLNRRLLALLKPGGRLLFNAPNLASCWLANQLWIDAAPPPDLVSMFPPGFWQKRFSEEALVEETVENCDPNRSLVIGVRKLLGRQWKAPVPVPVDKSSSGYLTGNFRNRPRHLGDEMWNLLERSILKVFPTTGLSWFVPKQPAEFGLLVKMTRR
jgi:SAM-dependent methyltransferase